MNHAALLRLTHLENRISLSPRWRVPSPELDIFGAIDFAISKNYPARGEA